MINLTPLPHELKQEHTTGLAVLKVLKVAHEQFTWSGGEIPHVGRYGGHKWHWFALKVWMYEKNSLSVHVFG